MQISNPSPYRCCALLVENVAVLSLRPTRPLRGLPVISPAHSTTAPVADLRFGKYLVTSPSAQHRNGAVQNATVGRKTTASQVFGSVPDYGKWIW